MYFNGDEALHGAYWHNNFGNRMSHGCVNMPIDVAEFVYDWAPDRHRGVGALLSTPGPLSPRLRSIPTPTKRGGCRSIRPSSFSWISRGRR